MTRSELSFHFDNTYHRLPERFFARVLPVRVKAPALVLFNAPLAEELGLDPERLAPQAAEIFSGNRWPADADPIALVYAGHQFGHFVPRLGDGRAHLMGEVIDRHGRRRDLQWKGSGQTPYSRQGDGRAWLGPVLREYLISEAMWALGIPTTRSLAAVTTGEAVRRERVLPGAVLTRVAASHLRVGTFEYFASRGDREGVRLLADYAMARHDPECLTGGEGRYLAFLQRIVDRQAGLIARWLLVGFIHGVMNTDNMSISGETIDYGPCAFMNGYDPDTVFSSIDSWGRYAFGNQPGIGAWNLARLAETLMPLFASDSREALRLANETVESFPDRFLHHWMAGMRHKLGLFREEPEDQELVRELLETMQNERADYTLTFRGLCAASGGEDGMVRALFSDPVRLDGWLARWRARLERDASPPEARFSRMRLANPQFIPRNHLVEAALEAAVAGDMQPFGTLLALLQRPYDDQPGREAYAALPPPSTEPFQTFCGT